MEFRLGDPVPRWPSRAIPRRRHNRALQGQPDHLYQHHVRIRDPRQATSRASFLNSGVRIELVDEREAKSDVFQHEGGLQEFVKHLNRSRTGIHPNVFWFRSQDGSIGVEVAIQWNDSYTESMFSYTNNIPQKDGGTHLAGFRAALTRTLNDYIEKEMATKKEKIPTTGDDAREGLTAILSVKLPDPKFSSQTKDKLVSSEVKGSSSPWSPPNSPVPVEHPQEAKAIVARSSTPPVPARPRARRARDPSQGRAGYCRPSRKTRRLPGERSRALRNLHRRG